MTTPLAKRRHLLSVADLGREGIVEILKRTDTFSEVSDRAIPKVPALRGKMVATLFFENSTRTRLSFETAAKRLSADTMSFSASSSSMKKGESLRDTVETIDAMGVDAMVVRHSSSGAPKLVSNWVNASVINAGDGAHEHPTQALLDCYTIREALSARSGEKSEDFSKLRIAIVGDVSHSRVARSDVLAFAALGARVTLVGPTTLMPSTLEDWPTSKTCDLDGILQDVDVIYVLRLQLERIDEALFPTLREYRSRFGLTTERARTLREDVLILHPGPMNRGVEIDSEVASGKNALVTRQVRNGVSVRMAVLYSLLASSGHTGNSVLGASNGGKDEFEDAPRDGDEIVLQTPQKTRAHRG